MWTEDVYLETDRHTLEGDDTADNEDISTPFLFLFFVLGLDEDCFAALAVIALVSSAFGSRFEDYYASRFAAAGHAGRPALIEAREAEQRQHTFDPLYTLSLSPSCATHRSRHG